MSEFSAMNPDEGLQRHVIPDVSTILGVFATKKGVLGPKPRIVSATTLPTNELILSMMTEIHDSTEALRYAGAVARASALRSNRINEEDPLIALALCMHATRGMGDLRALQSWVVVSPRTGDSTLAEFDVKLVQHGVARVYLEQSFPTSTLPLLIPRETHMAALLPHPLGSDPTRDILGDVQTPAGFTALVHRDPDNPNMVFENFVEALELD